LCLNKLPAGLGSAVSVLMAREGARLSPSPEGTMLRIIFGLTMIERSRYRGGSGALA
jgi:hypothetical protein